jgi:AcrR family transcriptional regulator
MMTTNAMALKPPVAAAPAVVFDPTLPVPRPAGAVAKAEVFGQNQRNRRSMILASIRRLLVDEGYEGITVRRIAEYSGHAVQTIYNLVGPRDLAITEAVTEYSQYICLTANPNPADPHAAAGMIDRELQSIEIHPEFCRNVCSIYFSGSRSIFYDFRTRQTKMLYGFLNQQQKAGIIRPGVDTRSMAENFMLFMGAIFVEWSDSSLPLDQVKQRLYAGYFSIMAEAIAPSARGTLLRDA